jgi:uncharacterized DUF497 family protein
MKTIILIAGILMAVQGQAQKPSQAALSLQPYRLSGQSGLKRNLSFGDYRTDRFRRTLGSFFSFGTFSLANAILQVEGIPLYKKDRNRSKDVFRFELLKNGEKLAATESRAIMRKNETFRLLSRQDSSFFGASNTDFLEAVIRLEGDSSEGWQMAASNLNGSKDEEQRGIIRKDTQEIRFTKTSLALQEKEYDRSDPRSLLATLNLVYAFTYRNEIVAAVSFRETDRRIWFSDKLDETIKTVIASAAAVLTFRRELYY